MGYNDVLVYVTVIKSDKRVLFHRTGSISSNKSDQSDCYYERHHYLSTFNIVRALACLVGFVLILFVCL